MLVFPPIPECCASLITHIGLCRHCDGLCSLPFACVETFTTGSPNTCWEQYICIAELHETNTHKANVLLSTWLYMKFLKVPKTKTIQYSDNTVKTLCLTKRFHLCKLKCGCFHSTRPSLSTEGGLVLFEAECGHSLIRGARFLFCASCFLCGVEPGVDEDLFGREPLRGFPPQKAAEQAPGRRGEAVGEAVLALANLREKRAGVRVMEWVTAHQEGVEHYAQAPNIRLLPRVGA